MVSQIQKRDGRVQPFCKQKIVDAICHAMRRAEQDDMDAVRRIAEEISKHPSERLTVEQVQDMVEMKLMKSSLKPTAKEYITYREKRSQERERNNAINKQIESVISGNHKQNSNANIDEASFSGKKFESANILHKNISLNVYMRPEVSRAHKESRLYTHDLSEYDIGDHNCLFADLQNLLSNGFSTRNGDVRPANSFSTACQLVAVIFQCQSQVQFGGVASAHLDYDLAPYVKKSFKKHVKHYFTDVEGCAEDVADGFMKMIEETTGEICIDNHFYTKLIPQDEDVFQTYLRVYQYAVKQLEREGKQAAQALYHNLNTLESRAGSQVPFSSINFGTDTSSEGRLVTRWMLEASLAGIGKYNLTSIFPISVFKYKVGVNDKPGTPNYDLRQLAEKSLSSRIYPNIVNCGYSRNVETPGDPDTEVATMGCRTMLGRDRHGLGYSKVGRGNVCPVTMNLPKIGIKHGICLGERDKADIDGFWEELDEVLRLTETALVDRFYHICAQPVGAATFMYQNGTIAGYKDANMKGIYEAMKHGTLAMGYIGIAEMCQALFGKDHSEDEHVHDFALSVVEHIYNWAAEASDRHDLNFGCYASPAESLCKTFAQALKDEFGVIKNVTDREYITNSHHVPVWQKVSIYKKLQTESPFCKFATAGCITYIELESSVMNNQSAVSKIIDYAMSLDIPYLAFNFPIDSCLKCGYQGEIEYNCPRCGNTEIQRLRRVTGYLTSDFRRFNAGKIAECLDRVKHSSYTSFAQKDDG